jgi:hypothetical protein
MFYVKLLINMFFFCDNKLKVQNIIRFNIPSVIIKVVVVVVIIYLKY